MICEYVCRIFVQKIAFYKIKLNHYSGITILHLCAKFEHKMFLLCRDILQQTFSWRSVPGAKKAITANSTPVLGEHGQQTSINKYYFIKDTKMLTDFRHISGSNDRKKNFHEKRIQS